MKLKEKWAQQEWDHMVTEAHGNPPKKQVSPKEIWLAGFEFARKELIKECHRLGEMCWNADILNMIGEEDESELGFQPVSKD